jgi:hypothetical protein
MLALSLGVMPGTPWGMLASPDALMGTFGALSAGEPETPLSSVLSPATATQPPLDWQYWQDSQAGQDAQATSPSAPRREDTGTSNNTRGDNPGNGLGGGGGDVRGDGLQPHVPAANPVTIKVASWNVLGASHTEGRGCNRCPLPDSAPRMAKTVQAIRAHDLHVLGLQEFQPSQQAMLRRQMPGWAIYANADNAVAWDTAHFTQVSASTVTIPYFGGNPRQMPVVRLRHNGSGREFTMISVHTPADVRGPAQHWRDAGVRNLGVLTNNLVAEGSPVILTGDMNDREDFFCQMTGYGMLHASAGGTRTPDSCIPPARMGVDWILGDTRRVTFTEHLSDDSPTVDFASDHPLIVTSATLT